ncbi:hypothetical protein LCGC14_2372830 [marine sediment metagenome]|uniref:Uncharacterized protein n=1 Tax=marine sediment metagenome TaxID=412755 RepID=A0A0F9EXU6_9ZZZZ
MTLFKAKEIMRLGSQYCNWSSLCTPEEIEEVNKVYFKMPGYASWYYALAEIAMGRDKDY